MHRGVVAHALHILTPKEVAPTSPSTLQKLESPQSLLVVHVAGWVLRILHLHCWIITSHPNGTYRVLCCKGHIAHAMVSADVELNRHVLDGEQAYRLDIPKSCICASAQHMVAWGVA